MNDVRKLMDTLRVDVEYKEFDPPVAPSARAGGWALLHRLDRLERATPQAALRIVEPIVAAEAPPALDPEPPLATQMRQAAADRGKRGLRGLALGKYAARPATEVEDGRKLPLDQVFARLAQGAR